MVRLDEDVMVRPAGSSDELRGRVVDWGVGWGRHCTTRYHAANSDCVCGGREGGGAWFGRVTYTGDGCV